MIQIFYGENRVKAQAEIKKVLGENYEVVDGVNLAVADLPSLLKGGSLFEMKRRILIRDLAEQKEAWEKLPDFLDTPHTVVIWEAKLDKRTATYKAIKDKVKCVEFAMPKDMNANVVFDIFRVAKRDGKQAVAMLEKIEETQDPYMFLGLLVSQALKDFEMRPGIKEKRVLVELSKLDMLMKSTPLSQFLLLKSFLLRVSSF